MRKIIPYFIIGFCIGLCLWLSFCAPPVRAQTVSAETVASCGTPNNAGIVGRPYPVTMDQTAKLCVGTAAQSIGPVNTAAPSYADQIGINVGGNLQAVSAGNPLPVSGSFTINGSTNNIGNVGVNQGSTTAGQIGPLVQCAVTTAAPTYVNGQTSPLSCDTSGTLRTSAGGGGGGTSSSFAAAFPATGTAIGVKNGANMVNLAADGSSNLLVSVNTALPAGTNLLGKVGIDQTTPGTTNGVQVNAALPAGTNVIGVVGNTQGSTTSGQSGPLVQAAVTTAGPTYTTGQTSPLSLDTSGNLRVNVVAGGSSGTVAQGSTTSGQNGMLTQGAVTTSAPTYTTAQTSPISLDTAGNLRTTDKVDIAAGAATAANGIPAYCAVSGTQPSYTAATTNSVSCDNSGWMRVTIGNAANQAIVTTPSDSQTNTSSSVGTLGFLMGFNGSTWERRTNVTATSAVAAGTGVTATAIAPNSAAGSALTAVPSTAVETGHVIKASAGNLYGFEVTSGASAGFIMVFNSTTVPADGAVTPVKCYVIAANATVAVQFSPTPLRLSTGVTLVFSTTGCFTKTASATAFISGDAS